MVVDTIKKHQLGLTKSNTYLGHQFSPHPLGLVRTEDCDEDF